MRGLRQFATLTALLGALLTTHVAAAAPHKGAPTEQKEVININTATPDQLQLLPGIGKAKAERIVAYRAKRKFKRPYELIRVRGIGHKTFRRLKSWLRVSGPTTLSKRPVTSKKK